MSRWIYEALLVLAVVSLASCQSLVVNVSGGKFEGTQAQSQKGRTYYSYKGIPFAQPPVDKLRFENPNTDVQWEGIKSSLEVVPHCAQGGLGYNEGFEDCLYLSVYTPKLPTEETSNVSLPVLVWLHGGAYIIGTSESYKPNLIMDRDMVVVIPQYRLGFLGFYTTHDLEAPGNYGMLDQIAALEWVRDNIAQFGGDPTRVTLGGECAGSAAALTHMTSPLSKDLFHGVIALSGTPLNPWAMHPLHNRFLMMIAAYFSCPLFNTKMFKECMQAIPTQQLVDALSIHLETMDFLVGNTNLAPISLSDSKDLPHQFLPKQPLECLLTGQFTKVPVLMGVTEHVGDYLVDMSYYYYLKYQQEERPEYFEKFNVKLLGNNQIFNLDQEVMSNITQFYLPKWDSTNVEDSLLDLGTMLGDLQYNAGIVATARLLSEHVPTRMMRFGFEGGPKIFNIRHPDPSDAPPMKARVTHGDELFFLFPETQLELTSRQQGVVEGMLNIIDNFVNAKTPLPDWPLFTKHGHETTVINAKGSVEHGRPFSSDTRQSWMRMFVHQQNSKIFDKIQDDKVDFWSHDEL